MDKYMKKYLQENKGRIIKSNDYSFVFETELTKDGKLTAYVVYLSYFYGE